MIDPESLQSATNLLNLATGLSSAIQGFIVQLLTDVATVTTAVISTAAVIAKYLPPPEQDGWLSKLHKYINIAAQNSKYAANATAENKKTDG